VEERVVLRVDAVAFVAFAILLLLSPWDALYDALDLPQGRPEVWTQLAAILLAGFGYLLWIAPRDPRLTHGVAAAGALVNIAGAVLVVGWLLVADTGVETLGTVLLVAIALAGVVFGALEALIASRSVALLLPPD
jgi:hypothetical protein